MEYKKIKYIDNLSNYEMAEDGSHVRDSKMLLIYPNEKSKVELLEDDGNKKVFGIKTLYWSSYGKALVPKTSQTAVSFGNAHKAIVVEAPKKKKEVYKPIVASKAATQQMSTRDGVLISGRILGEIRLRAEKHAKRPMNGLGFDDGKSFDIRILIYNSELKMALVKINSQNWRDGYWFLSLETGKHKSFVDGVDKKGSGNSSIIWPKEF